MTIAAEIEQQIEETKPIFEAGMATSTAIHNLILAGGEPARMIADFLHGTWLGHPLHPVLTDLTIGAWTLGGIYDAASALTGSEDLQKVADHAILTGTLSAIPTAITGIVDYSTFPEKSSSAATLHAVLNLANFGLYIGSVQARRSGNRQRGVLLSTIGLGLTAVSAWLGGSLVYKYGIGVDHTDKFEKPKRWTPVLDASKLHQRKPMRVMFDNKPVMLYRDGAALYAIGATCAHASGPLDEGKVENGCVQCPWHDSVFSLKDGSIVHGPACQPQPAFEVRIRAEKIEIRLKPKNRRR